MPISFDRSWTLFLDRDGVINRRIPGAYISKRSEFEWIKGSKKAIVKLSRIFGITVVVTNQQGIAKQLVRRSSVEKIHARMQRKIEKAGGRIDKVYYCPELANKNPDCRKPNTGMAMQARADFPGIIFKKSVIVGDSISDMEFGFRLGMKTVLIGQKQEEKEAAAKLPVDFRFDSLADFAKSIEER